MSLSRVLAVTCSLTLLPALAAAQEEAAPPTVSGAIAVDAVRKAMKTEAKKVAKCYDERRKARTELAGKLTLSWTLGADGAVATIAVDKKGSTFDDAGLVACVTGVVKAMRFGKLVGGASAAVSYAFLFKPDSPLLQEATAATAADKAKGASRDGPAAAKADRPPSDDAGVRQAAAERNAPAPAAPTASGGAVASRGEGRGGTVGSTRSSGEGYGSGGGGDAGGIMPSGTSPAAPPLPARPAEAKAPKKEKSRARGAFESESAATPSLMPAAEPALAGGVRSGKAAADEPVASAPTPRRLEAPALKAGRYDDNKQYNRFLEYLRGNSRGLPYKVDVSERLVVRVLDVAGKSLPNCTVEVKSVAGKALATSTTYADGTTQFFPADASAAADKDYTIAASCGQVTRQGQLSRSGRRVTDIRFETPRTIPARVPVDIAIVIDTTGSMQSQIDRLKSTLQSIHYALTQLSTKPDIRFGLVAYRDRGDDYVTQVSPFTDSIDTFQAKLDKLAADGGGDTNEDLQAALKAAMQELEWRKDALRLGFAISDAPPHTDYGQKYSYMDAAREALRRGVKWVTVGAGGLPPEGEVIFRQLSQFSMGEYVFVTESGGGDTDGGVGEASHHVGANYSTENLDQAIVRIVRRELSYLTEEPRDFDYTISAGATKTTPREEVFAPAVAEVLRQLADYSAIKLASKTPVAVIPVTVPSGSAAVGGYVSDQFILAATRSSCFKVVERDLHALAQEHKLQLSDLFDVTTTVPFGKLLGAEALIVAKLSLVGEGAELYAKLVRVETGEVLSAAKVKVATMPAGS